MAGLAVTPLKKLRRITLCLALQINALLGALEDDQGYAELHVSVKAGKLGLIRVERSFKPVEAGDIAELDDVG